MSHIESTIRAYQGVLTKFVFPQAVNFSEDFAIKRFHKKMEMPDPSKTDSLKEACFNKWLETDASLPEVVLPPKEWYLARQLIHKWVKAYLPKHAPIDFPQGSEFNPTRGRNSLEARLSQSKWTCTEENFGAFASLCFSHKALKRAVKKRYYHWFRKGNFDVDRRKSDRILWLHFRHKRNTAFEIFSWKLSRVTEIVRGSRFGTVPKNNEKRRPINVEPFGNLLVQRVMGNRIRSMLRSIGQDLDVLQDSHRVRIQDCTQATIDLSDASDSVSIDLVRFLLPPWMYEELMSCRSPMTLGLDKAYHIPKKISSMGCGFTFELMTLVLTALGRVLDPNASVYGDDIIISNVHAKRMIECMTSVGFKVNEDKSFVDSPFRESCGSNFHDLEGYIESYDFEFPTSINDCAMIFNKASALSKRYSAFGKLRATLLSFTPKALRGGPFSYRTARWSPRDPTDLPCYFMTETEDNPRTQKMRNAEQMVAQRYHYPLSEVRAFIGFRYVPFLRTRTVTDLNPKYHWAKYEMYLHGGRRTNDVVTGSGRWVECMFISVGQRVTRYSALAFES